MTMKRTYSVLAAFIVLMLAVGIVSAVTPPPFVVPNVDFTGNGISVGPITHTSPFPVTFVATLTPPAPGGSFVTYDWNFGDGSTMTGGPGTISHTYLAIGHYDVSVVVHGASGWSQVWSSMIQKSGFVFVTHDLPVPDFTFTPPTGVGPVVGTFTSTTTGFVTEYTWYVNDQIAASGPVMVYGFPQVSAPTDFKVILKAKGDVESVNSSAKYITINPQAPVAIAKTITAPIGVKPLVVKFSSEDSTGYDLGFKWKFGDNTTGTNPNPTHTYNNAGTYTVNLNVSSGGGTYGYDDAEPLTILVLENATDICPVCPEPEECPEIPPVTYPENNVGVFRGDTGYWYLDNTKTGSIFDSFQFGKVGDVPFTGDFDGVDSGDIVVFRGSTGYWYFDYDMDGAVDYMVQFGKVGDIPVVGDWDTNGITDIGVFRPSTGYWYLDYNHDGGIDTQFHFGKAGDIPVIGEW